MLKSVGSGLIVVASIGMAYSIREEMTAHLRLLYVLRKLLVDISYAAFDSRQPVEILLGCFVQTKDELVNEVCKNIAEQLMEKQGRAGEEIWREVFFSYRKKFLLNEDEAEVIESAGSAFFGKSVDENKSHLATILERLDFLIEQARMERKEKQKVYSTISVLCGLMIVILLI